MFLEGLEDQSTPKKVTYCYLQKLIRNTFEIKVNESTTTSTTARTRATKKNALTNGIYVDEWTMDQLLAYLSTDGIELKFSMKKIKFKLSKLWITTNLFISNTIKKNNDNSEIRSRQNHRFTDCTHSKKQFNDYRIFLIPSCWS